MSMSLGATTARAMVAGQMGAWVLRLAGVWARGFVCRVERLSDRARQLVFEHGGKARFLRARAPTDRYGLTVVGGGMLFIYPFNDDDAVVGVAIMRNDQSSKKSDDPAVITASNDSVTPETANNPA